jgi:hypothetical protein
MIKLIQRTTDNKYLQSVETDTWVDDVKDAFEMTYRECEEAKTELIKTRPMRPSLFSSWVRLVCVCFCLCKKKAW